MKSAEVLRRVQEISADQWGLFTTAQAKQQGIIGTELSRVARAGHIEPIIHGVHRLVGTPTDEYEGLRAVWLSTEPGRLAYERLDDEGSVVVSGATAAWLHGLGDLPPEPYEFSSPVRRQSRRADVRFRRRPIPQKAKTIAEGLPVTTVERTIGDLVQDRTDESLVIDCLVDAADRGQLNMDALAAALDPENPDRGAVRRDELLRAAGLDDESVIRRVAESPLGVAVAQRALAPVLAELRSLGVPQNALEVLEQRLSSDIVGVTPEIPSERSKALRLRLHTATW